MDSLRREFQRIKRDHSDAVQHFFARVVLGPSVVRVFVEGTKEELYKSLVRIDLSELKSVRTEEEYRIYFEKELNRLARVVKKNNSRNSRIYPGYKWGHSAKILCLFLRDMVLYSRYFSIPEVKRLSKFLYVPIDSIIINRLRKLDCEIPFRRIKEVDSRNKFYMVQDELNRAAAPIGVPRVWFDDNWGQRRDAT